MANEKNEYIPRLIDNYLIEWKNDKDKKTLLVRGARQVGKSSAIRNLSKHFKYYIEVNFDLQKDIAAIFEN